MTAANERPRDADSKRDADSERDAVIRDFKDNVNMAPAELERWLERPESEEVGQKSGGSGESVGHESGRRIVMLLRTKNSDYDDADIDHMRKVNGYIARHLAQRPDSDVTDSRCQAVIGRQADQPVERLSKRTR